MRNWFKTGSVAIFILLTAGQQGWAQLRGLAQGSQWWEEEGGRIRISLDFPDKERARGIAYGLIEVELKPGWKSYWKNPGTSGMAPVMQVHSFADEKKEKSQSQPVDVEFLFPPPRRIADGDGKGWIVGYSGRMALPFRLRLSDMARQPALYVSRFWKESDPHSKFSGHLVIGLCEHICMPALLPFYFDLSKPADVTTRVRIESALAALPQAADAHYGISKIIRHEQDILAVLKMSDKETESIFPDLFVHAQKAQLDAKATRHLNAGEIVYKINILSGKLEQGDKIDYVAVGEHRAVSDSFIIP